MASKSIKTGVIVTTTRELRGLPVNTICKVVGEVNNPLLGKMFSLQAETTCKCCGHRRIVLAIESDFTVNS